MAQGKSSIFGSYKLEWNQGRGESVAGEVSDRGVGDASGEGDRATKWNGWDCFRKRILDMVILQTPS